MDEAKGQTQIIKAGGNFLKHKKEWTLNPNQRSDYNNLLGIRSTQHV
jgi:hypothetical protein